MEYDFALMVLCPAGRSLREQLPEGLLGKARGQLALLQGFDLCLLHGSAPFSTA